MTDKDNNNELPPQSTPVETARAPKAPVKAPPKTRGEVIFDITDWWGIGAIANAVLSLGLADRASYLHWQAPLKRLTGAVVKTWPFRTGDAKEGSEYVQKFDTVRDAIFEKFPELQTEKAAGIEKLEGYRGLFNRIGKADEVLAFAKQHETLGAHFADSTAADMKRIMKAGFRYHTAMTKASSVAAIMMLGSGGFFLMAPIKWFEDRKEPIVKWLDEKFGPKNPTEEQKKQIEERHEFIKHEPKQSWTSVLLSRVTTLPWVYAFHFNLGSRDNIINRAAYRLTGTKERTFEGLDHHFGRSGEYLYGKFKNRNPEWLAETEMKLGQSVMEYDAALHAKAAAGNVTAQKNAAVFTRKPTQAENGEARARGFFTNLAPEAFYSATVATGTYIASRFLGPIFGIKSDEQITLENLAKEKQMASQQPQCVLPAPANDATVGSAITEIANKDTGAKLDYAPLPANRNKPDTRITAHQAAEAVKPRDASQLGASA